MFTEDGRFVWTTEWSSPPLSLSLVGCSLNIVAVYYREVQRSEKAPPPRREEGFPYSLGTTSLVWHHLRNDDEGASSS